MLKTGTEDVTSRKFIKGDKVYLSLELAKDYTEYALSLSGTVIAEDGSTFDTPATWNFLLNDYRVEKAYVIVDANIFTDKVDSINTNNDIDGDYTWKKEDPLKFTFNKAFPEGTKFDVEFYYDETDVDDIEETEFKATATAADKVVTITVDQTNALALKDGTSYLISLKAYKDNVVYFTTASRAFGSGTFLKGENVEPALAAIKPYTATYGHDSSGNVITNSYVYNYIAVETDAKPTPKLVFTELAGGTTTDEEFEESYDGTIELVFDMPVTGYTGVLYTYGGFGDWDNNNATPDTLPDYPTLADLKSDKDKLAETYCVVDAVDNKITFAPGMYGAGVTVYPVVYDEEGKKVTLARVDNGTVPTYKTAALVAADYVETAEKAAYKKITDLTALDDNIVSDWPNSTNPYVTYSFTPVVNTKAEDFAVSFEIWTKAQATKADYEVWKKENRNNPTNPNLTVYSNYECTSAYTIEDYKKSKPAYFKYYIDGNNITEFNETFIIVEKADNVWVASAKQTVKFNMAAWYKEQFTKEVQERTPTITINNIVASNKVVDSYLTKWADAAGKAKANYIIKVATVNVGATSAKAIYDYDVVVSATNKADSTGTAGVGTYNFFYNRNGNIVEVYAKSASVLASADYLKATVTYKGLGMNVAEKVAYSAKLGIDPAAPTNVTAAIATPATVGTALTEDWTEVGTITFAVALDAKATIAVTATPLTTPAPATASAYPAGWYKVELADANNKTYKISAKKDVVINTGDKITVVVTAGNGLKSDAEALSASATF